MAWMRNRGVSGDFERFAAGLSDSLLYTGFQLTGNAKDAEDLVQETLLKVARRWNRVRLMDHPAAYVARQRAVSCCWAQGECAASLPRPGGTPSDVEA